MKIFHVCFILLFFGCKSSKFEKTIPFQIEKATFQHWIGGQPGVRGIKIEFLVTNLNSTITFQNLYFQNKIEKLYLRNSDKNKVLTANINTAKNANVDLIIHKDPIKEYGNKPPKTDTKFPFDLKENECVISYIQNKKELFYKVFLIKEENAFYP